MYVHSEMWAIWLEEDNSICVWLLVACHEVIAVIYSFKTENLELKCTLPVKVDTQLKKKEATCFYQWSCLMYQQLSNNVFEMQLM